MLTNHSPQRADYPLERLIKQGAMAGLGGGLVFGVVMAFIGMFPMVGMLIGRDNSLVGFLVHMVISAVIGAGFGVVMYVLATKKPIVTLLIGVLYGLFWWLLGALILMPVLLGMPQMILVVNSTQLGSLLGHILYGVITALVMHILAEQREKQWRTDFVNLIIHDRQNPLSGLTVGVDLMLDGRLGQVSERQRVLLTRAKHSTQDMADLIANLLDIERMEAGVLHLNVTPCDLNELLRDAVDSTRALAETRDLSLTLHTPEMSPVLEIDTALIRRVVQNLLTNAVKFTPEKGCISVEALPEEDSASVRVSDTGPGIPLHERKRIFKKFAQLKGSERRGTGLGLTFCKLAVERHGGHITVEDAAGGGSCFAFTLPVAHPASQSVYHTLLHINFLRARAGNRTKVYKQQVRL